MDWKELANVGSNALQLLFRKRRIRYRDDLKAVKYLIEEQQLDPKTKDILGRNALHSLLGEGYSDYIGLDTLKYLIEDRKVDPRETDILGRNALLSLCKEGSFAWSTKYLIEKQNMDPNQKDLQGWNALSYLSRVRFVLNTDLFKYLIEEKRMDPNEKDNDGRNALDLCTNQRI